MLICSHFLQNFFRPDRILLPVSIKPFLPFYLLGVIIIILGNLQISYGQEQPINNETDKSFTKSLEGIDNAALDAEGLASSSQMSLEDNVIDQTSQFSLKPKVTVALNNQIAEIGIPISTKIVKENPPFDSRVIIKWGDTKEETVPHNDDKVITVEHIYDEVGFYTVYASFTACDPDNTCISDSKNIQVQQSILPPPQPSVTIDNADPDNPLVNDVLSIEGRIQNPPSDSFTIDWGDGESTEQIVPSDSDGIWDAEHRYGEPGSYTITATLEDCDESFPCEATTQIEVQQSILPPPQPSVTIDNADPDNPLVNDVLSIEGSTINAPSDSLTVNWGDNSDDTDVTLGDNGNWFSDHVYQTSGEHVIRATFMG